MMALSPVMTRRDILWDELLYGGHWLSLGASAIALSVMLLFSAPVHWTFLLIVYLGTQCIYNYNHYKEFEADAHTESPRIMHLRRYYTLLPVLTSIYGILFCLVLVVFGNRESILFGLFLLLIGLLFTYKGKSVSRRVTGFKSVYAAVCWALLVLFTTFYITEPFNLIVVLVFLFVFLRWIINTSFFDIKDIDNDKKSGLKTLPVVFQGRWLSTLHVLNAASFLPLIVGVMVDSLPLSSLFLLPLFFYTMYYIEKAKRTTDIYTLSHVIVDGEYYYWPALIFAGTIILKYLQIT